MSPAPTADAGTLLDADQRSALRQIRQPSAVLTRPDPGRAAALAPPADGGVCLEARAPLCVPRAVLDGDDPQLGDIPVAVRILEPAVGGTREHLGEPHPVAPSGRGGVARVSTEYSAQRRASRSRYIGFRSSGDFANRCRGMARSRANAARSSARCGISVEGRFQLSCRSTVGPIVTRGACSSSGRSSNARTPLAKIGIAKTSPAGIRSRPFRSITSSPSIRSSWGSHVCRGACARTSGLVAMWMLSSGVSGSPRASRPISGPHAGSRIGFRGPT